jgi:ribose transport system permease protein
MMSSKMRMTFDRYKDYIPSLVALVLILVVCRIKINGFFSASNLSSIFLQTSILTVVAMGTCITVMAGDSGLDLSTGSLMIVGAVLGPSLRLFGQESLVFSFLVVMLVGALIGAINGVCIYYLRIPALVMTMAMSGLVAGVMIMITKAQITLDIPQSLSDLTLPVVGPFRRMVVIVMALVIVMQFLLSRTRVGQYLVLTGNNRDAAKINGLPVAQVAVGAYMASAALSAAAGMLLVGYSGLVHIDMTSSFPMRAMASVFIGGAHAAGGKGSFVGCVVGAMVLVILDSLLIAFNISTGARVFFQGMALLLILFINNRAPRLRQ